MHCETNTNILSLRKLTNRVNLINPSPLSSLFNLTQDPGIQFYGGQLFRSIRDYADDQFNGLPAPTPQGKGKSCEVKGSLVLFLSRSIVLCIMTVYAVSFYSIVSYFYHVPFYSVLLNSLFYLNQCIECLLPNLS